MFLKSPEEEVDGRYQDRVTITNICCPVSHQASKMPYVLVRESFINCYSSVEGLPLNEGKILGKILPLFYFFSILVLVFIQRVLFRIFRIIRHYKRFNSRLLLNKNSVLTNGPIFLALSFLSYNGRGYQIQCSCQGKIYFKGKKKIFQKLSPVSSYLSSSIRALCFLFNVFVPFLQRKHLNILQSSQLKFSKLSQLHLN